MSFFQPTYRIASILCCIAAGLLSACGGGSGSSEPVATKQAQAADPGSATIDATALLGWAEKSYASLFPTGPQNAVAAYKGKTWTYRYYPSTQTYLGVAMDDGTVLALGPFTGNQDQTFGKLADWTCEVLGQTCLSGVAASAAALGGATVEAKCLGATALVSGSTVTAGDGSYSLALNGASLPCLLRVTAADGTTLHSLAIGSGSGARSRVHLTPLTDLVAAHAFGGDLTRTYTALTLATATTVAPFVTYAFVGPSSTSVIGTLKTAGVDFSAAGDPFSATLLPGSGGNAYGRALAQLADKLAGNLSQATLVDAITRTTTAAKASGTPSLPANLLLLPAAANCSALRSGKYRAVFSDLGNKHDLLTVDAATLTLTNSKGVVTALVADGKCHYKLGDGREYAVTDAGVMVGRALTSGTTLRAMVAFPEQSFALADIAGSYNFLSLEATPDEGAIHAGSLTMAADGQVTALTYCGKDAGKLASDCFSGSGAAIPNISHSVNPAGGFDEINSTDGYTDRLFVYRSGSGELMFASGGQLSLATPQRPATAPAVGRVQEYWNLTTTPQYTAPSALTQGKSTSLAIDTAAGTYRRDAVFNLDTGATRAERLETNRFLPGFVHRIPETVAGSDGSTQNVGEFVALGLRGSGLSAVGLLGSTQSFAISIAKSTAP